ncbi:MAG: hypothetical protein MJ105_07985 [Lachnospiraceae bacterium]|nr:hypothetical protein [Lachnospiraceae bacterium]
MATKKAPRNGAKATILMIVMMALILGYFFYLRNKGAKANSSAAMEENVQQEMTTVQEMIARAPYKEYPATPVQVLKYYNEISACFYNEEYSNEELEGLAHLAQGLYDTELIANQTWDAYISNLKNDIQTFHDGNITVYKSEVTPATDVEYFTHNGYECAKLYCMYTLKSGTVYQSSREVYIMRKDGDGHWKIYGFQLVDQIDN